MGKVAPDATIDSYFDYIDQADLMTACNAEPTTFTEATATFKLADVAMTPNTDFTKGNGDVSGRKVTVAAKTAVPVDTSGTATHVALTKSAGSVLVYVTTCTSQSLTSGNTVNFPTWDIEMTDPT